MLRRGVSQRAEPGGRERAENRATEAAGCGAGSVPAVAHHHPHPKPRSVCIAGIDVSRRGEVKFLVDNPRFGVWTYCTMYLRACMMRSRRRQQRRASNEKLAGAETMESGASRAAFERNADSKFDAVLADANQRGHAQIDPRADRGRLGKPRRPCRIPPARCTSVRAEIRRQASRVRPPALPVDCVNSWGTAWRTKVSCGQAAVCSSGLLHVCRADPYDANTPMATSAGELREARGAEARVTSGASRAAQSKKRRYEVRRRNGHRKVARTLADRILALTKAVQGNLDGFVACARIVSSLRERRRRARAMRGLWNARFAAKRRG